MAQLREQFLFDVAERMRMGEQKGAAGGTNEGEDESGAARGDPPCAHRPFKTGKSHDQHDEDAVLEHVGNGEALPEATRTQGPVFRVVAKKQKYSQPQEGQRPMSRPTSDSGVRQNRE